MKITSVGDIFSALRQNILENEKRENGSRLRGPFLNLYSFPFRVINPNKIFIEVSKSQNLI